VRLLGKLSLATEIIRAENHFDVSKAMAGDGRYLWDAAPRYCKPSHCRAAQIVEVQIVIA
jgi:hypothetical protein